MEFLVEEEKFVQRQICRFCLIVDVRMYSLQNYPLESYIEHVFGMSVMNTLQLPPFLCYECAALVKKFYLFKVRSLKGQQALYEILRQVGEFPKGTIINLDRNALGLTSSLTCHTFIASDLNPEESVRSCEPDTQVIKNEPIDDCINDLEEAVDNGSIKEDDPEIPSVDYYQSSDDEPLSIHKSNKEKKKGKKRGRKKKEVGGVEDDVTVPQEPSEPVAVESGVKRKLAPNTTLRRAKYQAGDDISIEDHVTMITLTLEEQQEEINKRKTSSNYLNASYQCDLCFKGFIDANAWKHHQEKHDPSAGELECPVCRFRFQTRRTLHKHAVYHEKKYACKSCPHVSKNTTQARQHQKWHKGVTYSCEYCDEVSITWTSYLSHVRRKHPSEHICAACGYSFVSQLGLAMHRAMMHKHDKVQESEEQSGPYCEECDVKFISSEAYNRHMVTSVKHAQSNNFSKGCRVCGATFNNREELRIHHRKEHPRSRPKNYGKNKNNGKWPAECPHCGDMIENARTQWAHFRRAHPNEAYPIQKDYICDICGKSFRANTFLNYHKRTHTSERPYACGVCGKAFFNRANLSVHERTHSDLRPYPCQVCLKAFKCKGTLDRHHRSHTGVKPYECEVCGKAFAQSDSRKLHVRKVHFKQPAPNGPRPPRAPRPAHDAFHH